MAPTYLLDNNLFDMQKETWEMGREILKVKTSQKPKI
jgi:hypothetical protein